MIQRQPTGTTEVQVIGTHKHGRAGHTSTNARKEDHFQLPTSNSPANGWTFPANKRLDFLERASGCSRRHETSSNEGEQSVGRQTVRHLLTYEGADQLRSMMSR